DPGLAGGAHGDAQPDPALRPDDADPGPDAADPWLGAPEGGGRELPRRPVRGSVQRSDARFQGVRQDPDSAARRDRRQQAAVGRIGADQGTTGRLSSEPTAQARCAAATAAHPRGAGSAIKGAGATPWCYRSAGRSPPSRPPSRRGEGGFLRDREIYYDARRDDGLATAKWREPTRSDRLPVHRSESQPAIPRRVAPQQS